MTGKCNCGEQMTDTISPNPLIPELLDLLRGAPEGISEFSLMKGLKPILPLPNWQTTTSYACFKSIS